MQAIDINEEVAKCLRREITEAELEQILDNALIALAIAIAETNED